MELIQISQQLYNASLKIEKMPHEIYKRAKEYAEAEQEYRKTLSVEIMKLKTDGLSVSIINDVARGNVADKKYERDLKYGLYKGAIESKKALEAELSALQSLSRHHSEL